MLLMVSGLIDLSWLMHRYQNVTRAAHDSARVGAATVENVGDCLGVNMIPAAEAHGTSLLTTMGISCAGGCTVTATADDSGPVNTLSVEIDVPFDHLFGLFEFGTTLGATFTHPADYQNSSSTNCGP